MGKITLRDIVSLPAFEEGGRLLHDATGMSLSFYNEDREVVFYPAECRCEYCHLIQSTEQGKAQCMMSDKKAAEAAMKSGMPFSYKCHAGLVDVAIPVVVGGERIGCFYSGQSLLTPPTQEDYSMVRHKASELGLDPDHLCELYDMVPIVDNSKLHLALGLLRVICHHIVEGEFALRQERILSSEQRKLRKAAEEKARLERDLREMELRLVSAQLHPHFLFNALNLIIGQALKEDAPETIHLLEELTVLLRRSLSGIGSMVTLAEEIESARAYVEVFRARFEKNVDIRVNLPRKIGRVKVPALMLQPLVENALVHALPRCKGVFRMSISAEMVDGCVKVKVADNGQGLSRKEISAITRSFAVTGLRDKLTGLPGLNWRLKYYYPGAADLCLEQGSEGLEVVLSLPVTSESSGR